MLNRKHTHKISLACVLLAAAAQTWAAPGLEWAENRPLSEVWVNPGMISYHYQRDKDLNDFNPGLGVEYRCSTAWAVTAGVFYNSDRDYSRYVGVFWHPLAYGKVRLGAVAGGFDGYPKMRDGGWFLAVIPVASYETGDYGLNFGLVPHYKDRLYGALSFQFKYRIGGN